MTALVNKTSASIPPPVPARRFEGTGELQYRERFSRRAVLLERTILLADFTESGITRMFQDRYWEGICSLGGQCSLEIVREFYSNISTVDPQAFTFRTFLRGSSFLVTPDRISALLGIPRTPRAYIPHRIASEPDLVSREFLSLSLTGTAGSWGPHLLRHRSMTVAPQNTP